MHAQTVESVAKFKDNAVLSFAFRGVIRLRQKLMHTVARWIQQGRKLFASICEFH